ncbi:MAG: hypothetical protein AAFU79_00645 [Myxococcota bacterium]
MAARRPLSTALHFAALCSAGLAPAARAGDAVRPPTSDGVFGVIQVNLAALRAGPWADLAGASPRRVRRGWRAEIDMDVTPLDTVTLFLHRDGPALHAAGDIQAPEVEDWLDELGFARAALPPRGKNLWSREGGQVWLQRERILAAPSAELLAMTETGTTAPYLESWFKKRPESAYAWAEAVPPADLPALVAARITPQRIHASLVRLGGGAHLEAVCVLESPKMARRALWWLMQNAARWESLLPENSLDGLDRDARRMRFKVRGRSLVLELRLSPATLRALAGLETARPKPAQGG